MIKSLLLLFLLVVESAKNKDFDQDVQDVVSYLTKNTERANRRIRRRLDGPYYQDGTGCDDLTGGNRRHLTEYMYENPDIVRHIQRHRELTQSCSDERPWVRADFCGLFTDTGGARLTLFADTFGSRRQDENGYWVENNFWSSESAITEWRAVNYNDTSSLNRNVSDLVCDTETCPNNQCCPPQCDLNLPVSERPTCRDEELNKYFLFASKAAQERQNVTFPRVEYVNNTEVDELQIFVSTAIANSGPLVMSFAYDVAVGSGWDNNFDNETKTYFPNCQWTPYQVVAWVIPQDPEITGFVDGGVNDPATEGLVISTEARPYVMSDTTSITIFGNNFDPDPGANTFTLKNNDETWAAAVTAYDETVVHTPDSCKFENGVWSPNRDVAPSISTTPSLADEESKWVVLQMNSLSPLNGGINYNILRSNNSLHLYPPFSK